MEDLSNRVAVVTGAGGGMGRSIALALAAEGVDVVVSDIEGDAAEKVANEVRELGRRALGVATDVSQLDQVEHLADLAYEEFGAVDILVNNAGVTMRPFRASWDTELRDFQWVMNVNWYGALHGHLAFVPRMREQKRDSHIVNTSSMTSMFTVPGHSAYSASKAAIDAFSMCAREEFKIAGIPIAVSVFFPGAVKTRVGTSERLRPEADRSDVRHVKPWTDYTSTPAAAVGAENLNGLTPLSEVTNFMQPMHPDEVGPLVVNGIRQNYDFISSHPAPADLIQDRADRLANSFHGLS
ncbi:SDR family NAD(P)-dependent oxidoreductase [Pseudarthrobacter sp. fls2-241-R2A-168]|uniref:SDR family NAD(P)-dependent oxidoreductase n=1 Tax=Pseudarthrobacter sp. fls2-241-R2A-168 TaxID=3040304 RepID=UPI002552A140|nr:SDR family NAD(P)-dependent oxidoreductase [Pseudarthrobacter sp. fls2-241-R2A-168]